MVLSSGLFLFQLETVITLMELYEEKQLWAAVTLPKKAKDMSCAFPGQRGEILA